MKQYFREFMDKLLLSPEANSRFVFTFHGVFVTLAIFVLSVAFIFAHNREGYDYMVGLLGGSNVASAVGRFMTKKGDGQQ